MIARLRGALIEQTTDASGKAAAHWVVVECAGVGYAARVSAVTVATLPSIGAEATLRIFTHAHENHIMLYGFATAQEREMFDLLIKVKDVGPAKAMEILSGAPSISDLAELLAHGEAKSLTGIRGIGKKTAERLVVELREKCEVLLATWRASGVAMTASSRTSLRDPRLDDVASALVNMSFRSQLVEDVVARLAPVEGTTVEELLRDALKELRDIPR